MKPVLQKKLALLTKGAAMLFMVLLIGGPGCKKAEIPRFLLNGYEQVNLVSDIPGRAARTDSALVNPWGITEVPSGPIWISENGTGLSSIFDNTGALLRPPVTIPSPDSSAGGTPTGIVFNGTTDFAIRLNEQSVVASKFIFATEDGTLAAWGGGNTASIVADQSKSNAVYKGLALAQDGADNFLYATNFHAARIDVFDKNFALVSGKAFHDHDIPSGFAPFNIRNIGGWLYVTYAKQDAAKHDDMAGPGNGFIDIFKPNGSLVKRFATRGALNSPWGIVQATMGFSHQSEQAILVGNFGDGHINVYDDDGIWVGPLQDGGHPIWIDGLWSLENNVPKTDSTRLYFTAGPDKETHGLFGYLQPK